MIQIKDNQLYGSVLSKILQKKSTKVIFVIPCDKNCLRFISFQENHNF